MRSSRRQLLEDLISTGHHTHLPAVMTPYTDDGKRKWWRQAARFGAARARGPALLRYAVAYALGYVLNWIGLYVMVDRAGWPHEIVQAAPIAVVAAVSFVLLRNWVFRDRGDTSATDRAWV